LSQFPAKNRPLPLPKRNSDAKYCPGNHRQYCPESAEAEQPKIRGKNVPWVSIAADVANAEDGNGATSANIVAAGSAESQPFNAAFGPPN